MIETLKKFFAFCRKNNRKMFYQAIFLSLITALCEAIKFPAIAYILNTLLEATISYRTVLYGFLILALPLIIASFARAASTMLQCKAGYGEAASKRIDIAEHLRYLPMGYFNENSLGEITSITTNTMEMLGDVATRVVLITTQGILNTAVILLMIFLFDWRIGLTALIGVIIFLLVNRTMQKSNLAISLQKVVADTDLVADVLEYIQGIPEVKAYNLIGNARGKINNSMQRATQTAINLEFAATRFNFIQLIILKLTGVAISAISIWFYLQGRMELVPAIIMTVMSFLVFSGLENMGNYSALLRVVELSVDRAKSILDLPTMDIEGEDYSPRKRDIAVKTIDFAYDKKKVIDNVSLSIPEKTSAAFVGPSGSGKTTLCKLLARFWDVQKGEVLLDEKNVKDYSMDSLMANFSFVFQRVYLFRDTVANNIRFGQPDAPMEKVIEAAKKACCHDFIMQLPEQYETVIDEKGASFSGGEKQRISIARAMMKNAPIVILDEATANVDPENEKELMEAIKALTKEKTVIMIAHRLKTVRDADQIFVLDKGKIVQKGAHNELMKQEGIYRRFVDARRQAISWKIH